ncbi:unnamed protein product, partial [Symbiodinium sp. KB8]
VALSENQRAVTLRVREPSWMSCELGTTIYVADFGQLSLKPELRLAVLHAFAGYWKLLFSAHSCVHLDWPPVLRLLTTRESGKAYYATVGIEVSAAVRCAAAAFKYKYQTRRDRCFPWLLFVSRALLLRYAILTRWLLSAAPSLEKAYSRMALLLTPGRFIQLCNGLRVEARPKNAFLNGVGVHAKDGQLELGIEAAAALNLCQLEGRDMKWRSRRYVFAVSQIRGILYTVKGNLNINPALGMTIVVPHQCIKVRSVGRVELRHGFTLVRTTTRQLKQPGVAAECVCAGAQVFTIKSWSMGPVPGLSYHLLAVLKLRAACDPSGARQREFRNQELVDEAREFTKTTLVDRSFGLTGITREPDDLVMVERDVPVVKRLPLRDIKMRPIPDGEAETDLQPFRQEGMEKLRKGKLNLLMPGRAATLVAVCETSSRLRANQVYVLKGGVALTGVFVAWRYPCYGVNDVQLMEAVLPPDGVAVADNAITYSDRGGDLDGDYVQVSFNQKIVALVRGTGTGVQRLGPLFQRLEADIVASMTEPCTGWQSDRVEQRGAEFRRHLKTVSSYNVRGRMCGLLERICHAALEEDAAGEISETMLGLFHFTFVSHHVMDVPGKWGLDEFLDLAAAVLKQHGLSRKGTRIADSLRPHFEMQLGGKKCSVAYDTSAFIRYVVKGHLKKNRPSAWSDLPRDAFARALTRKRRTSMRTFLVGLLLAVATTAFPLERVLLGVSLVSCRSLSSLLSSPLA